LRANLPVLERSRKLVRLIRDVPVSLDWDAARVKPERLSALAPLFRELGFSRMLGLLEQVVGANRGAIAAAGAVATQHSATRQADTEPIPGGLFGGGAATQGHPVAQDAPATDAPHDRPSPVATGGVLQPVVGDYRLVHSRATLDAMIGTLRAQLKAAADAGPGAWLAVDTETDSLGAMSSNLCGISLSALEGTGYYVAVKGAGGEVADGQMVRALLGPLLGDEAIAKVGQNLKYDINSLRVFGIDLGGVWLDTMVASYVLDSSRLSHGMDALAADWLGLQPIPIRDLIGKGAGQISFADVPVERACGYSA
jgi:DNA polymerase-1